MDQPSSSNVTGRRKRTVLRDDDDDDFSVCTPARKVRGTKRQEPPPVAPDSVMAQVNEKVDEIINSRKVGASNCFEYKSPLELYGIEKMIAAKASIQEMATMLESSQMLLGYRVDRLHFDVRNVDAALSGRDMGRGEAGDTVHLSMDNRRAKKKLAISDGMNGMSAFLTQMGEEEDLLDTVRRNLEEQDLEDPFDADVDLVRNAGEPPAPEPDFADVMLFLDRDIFPEILIKQVSFQRSGNFSDELLKTPSPCIPAEDTIHDLKDASIDHLRTNAMFQKATRGAIDNMATSFHSLNHYGIHSPSGRAVFLHSRIVDKHADDRYFTSDATLSLVNNTRALLENSLAKKPMVLDNYLMLEVRDRPVVGKYKIMSKDVKKSTLPLAEAARERDLANLTFAEMNRANSRADMTIAGTSDMSMLPGNQGLPLADGDDDETMIIGEYPGLNQTLSLNGQIKANKDEYVPPPLEALSLEESLIGKVAMDAPDTDDIAAVFDQKLHDYNTSDALESKLWKNGLNAEEWGANDETAIETETRPFVTAGVDGWFKGTDTWANSAVVRMVVTRESCFGPDEDQETTKSVQPAFGTNIFLMKSEEYMNLYPADRHQEYKIIGEELEVMKMNPGVDGEEDDRPLEDIQREIQQMNVEEPDVENIDDDYDGANYEVDFDDHLAAPADTDDFYVPPNADDDVPAEILFNNPIEEQQDEMRGELVIQRELEKIALGPGEVAELMTAAPPPDLVGPSAEMREEIRNIGKNDNAHWIPPDVADHERQAAQVARQKKKDRKKKGNKATVEEYVHYFREIPEEDRDRETTAGKCIRVADERSTFLTEQQIYLPTLGTENKPHIALDLTTLTISSLFFKTDSEVPPSIRNNVMQKNFGKLRLERTGKGEQEDSELFVEDTKGNKDSDCLSWLLTFSGFKCMENPVAVSEADASFATQPFNNAEEDMPGIYFDDEYDRYNSRQVQELAISQMGSENQKKFTHFSSSLFHIQNEFRPRKEHGEFDDSDDEFDSFDHQTIQAKNLDAAKHKKCIADILNNQTLSMPSIQFCLEQLSIKNNTTIRPSTSDRNATMSSPVPYDPDATLKTVFDYNSPGDVNHNVHEIMEALGDVTTNVDSGSVAPNPDGNQPSTSQYGTVNTEQKKVKINGFHTLMSLALSMPPKMGESVKPSSIVSFILHVANENSLKIVQDRSKKAWMTDFVVLNQSDQLPTGLKMGSIDEQGEFWMKTQDPDAVEGAAEDQAPLFSNLIHLRPKAVAVRKGRGLGAIAEEDEADRSQ